MITMNTPPRKRIAVESSPGSDIKSENVFLSSGPKRTPETERITASKVYPERTKRTIDNINTVGNFILK